MPFLKWLNPLEPIMSSTIVTLDRAGRVVIPKSLRDELHLEPGDSLALDTQGDSVTLRPIRSTTPLRKDRGVWVFRTGQKLTAAMTEKALRESREQRDRGNRGGMR